MATYVVGDVQGCYEPLRRLLKSVAFDADHDELWSAGDLINRGPDSLETVRFARSLGDRFKMVLGNHDFHYLAVAAGVRKPKRKDTLDALLRAPDAQELFEWVRRHPVALRAQGVLLVHAGVDPRWTLQEALHCADELETWLHGEDYRSLLEIMFGNHPNSYDSRLSRADRARCITNVFTRMRFCTAGGILDFSEKGNLTAAPPGMKAWFAHADRPLATQRTCFGHWAALEGQCDVPLMEALDTGCVWGGRLTALRLEDNRRFSVPATTK